MLRKLSSFIIPFAVFAVFACVILLGQYADMLFTAQDRNECFASYIFFEQKMGAPFGVASWIGSYLTQFFYHPALGVSLLLVLWGASYALTVRLMRSGAPELNAGHYCLALLPLACLLGSLTDVGYWIYIMPQTGYWFAHSVVYLLTLLMLCGAQQTPRRLRPIWYVLVAFMALPLLGWGAVLFCIAMLLMQVAMPAGERSPWWQHAAGVVVVIALPLLLARTCYTELHISQVFRACVPYFYSDTVSTIRTSYPFLLLVLLAVPLFLAQRIRAKAWLLAGISAVLVAGCTWMFGFRNYNYQAEMRMNRMAMEDDWQSIILEEQRAERPSRTMVALTNVALMNTGELGSRAFALGNNGVDITNPDSLNVNIMQIASPMLYYNYGKVQFGLRWCMENTSAHGMSPYFLKMNVRLAQLSGEKRLQQHYQHLLSLTSFNDEWRPKPTSPLVAELKSAFVDVIDSDDSNCEVYLIENFGNASGSVYASVKELNLFYAMLYRNPQAFWKAFSAYAAQTNGANLPLHYQEAYIIMMQNYAVQLPFQVQITPSLKQSLQMYGQEVNRLTRQGLSEEQIGEQLAQAWRHTYWWHLMYGRKAY